MKYRNKMRSKQAKYQDHEAMLRKLSIRNPAGYRHPDPGTSDGPGPKRRLFTSSAAILKARNCTGLRRCALEDYLRTRRGE